MPDETDDKKILQIRDYELHRREVQVTKKEGAEVVGIRVVELKFDDPPPPRKRPSR